ncbi:hypothetical protein D3C77_434080 [compost metagenome]
MGRVALAHLCRHRNQRRPVIEGATVGHVGCGQREEVATPQFNPPTLVAGECALSANIRPQTLFGKKSLHRRFRQLDTQHRMALLGQPRQVKTLAAQRHQHPGIGLKLQRRPEPLKPRVHPIQVEADFVTTPASLPKILMHVPVLYVGPDRASDCRMVGTVERQRGMQALFLTPCNLERIRHEHHGHHSIQ